MGLAVVGDNVQAWLVAAHASASSGETVALVDAGFPAERMTLAVRYVDREARATIELAPALRDGDVCVVIAAPELATQRAVLRTEAASLSGRTIILAPGGAGGAVRAAALLAESSAQRHQLAELTGFPVLGTITGRFVDISAVKRHLPIGVLDPADTSTVLDLIGRFLPDVVSISPLASSLANTNNVVHPPLAVINAARIDGGRPFQFYRDGLTPAGADLIEAVDRERLVLTDALGIERIPITHWFRRFYADQGMAGEDIGTMLGSFGPFEQSLGPSSLAHRYLVDDVGSGLAVLEAVGRHIGLGMPVTSAICDLASALVHLDLRVGSEDTAAAMLRHGPARSAPLTTQVGALASTASSEGS